MQIRQLADYFGAHLTPQRDAHERDRARQRAVIACVFALVSAWSVWGAAAPTPLERAVPWISVGYALVALFHMKVTLSRPRQGVLWQYAFIVLDSALTVLGMAGAPAVLAAFYPLLMVQIVRCGMRYGMRTLWLAWGAGALAALLLLPYSAFWMGEPQMLKSFVLMMLIVPLLFGPLIRTLHRVTDELRTAAGSDPLTGLGNRRLLEEHMRMARARSERDGTMLALIVFDLDNFKHVNDTLGHATGDQLLVRVAQALRANCRASDVIARVGGDEFVLLVEGLSALGGRQQAEAMAHKIQARIKAEAEAFVPGAGVSASAGVRCWSHVLDAQTEVSDLLATADEAMYEAKRAGKGGLATARA